MNFLAYLLQPAVGTAGIVSRVQLPATGQVAFAHPALRSGKALPPSSATKEQNRQRDGLALHRAQHHAQCRANCMSKANF